MPRLMMLLTGLLVVGCPSSSQPDAATPAPVKLLVDQLEPLTIPLGATTTFTARLSLLDGGAPPKYRFDPSPAPAPEVATTFEVTTTGAGTETVTVLGQNYTNELNVGLRVCPDRPYPTEPECDALKVPVFVYGGPPSKVRVPFSTTTLVVGERRRLDAYVLAAVKTTPQYPSSTNRSHMLASWSSADPTVATITPDGVVEARAAGTTTFTATAGNASSAITVSVKAGQVGPPPDGVTKLLEGFAASRVTVGPTVFDDRGFVFVSGSMSQFDGTVASQFDYPWLLEWTGGGWGFSLITPPSKPGAVEALVVDDRTLYLLLRTRFGVEVLTRPAADPTSAWKSTPLDRLSGLHPELDPAVQQERFDLMELEGSTPYMGAAWMTREDGGLYFAASSYEGNEHFAAPFQCVENVRLFELTESGITTKRDIISQRLETFSGTCSGPAAPGGGAGTSMTFVPRLPGEPFPRLIYSAAPGVDESGQRLGSRDGPQEFIPRAGRWVPRPLVPDGGIDIGQGRTATSIVTATWVQGTPLDPQYLIAMVPDSFTGGSATLARVMLRQPDAGWQPTPVTLGPDELDPLINLGRVPAFSPPSRWGRRVSIGPSGVTLSSAPPRQPLFTDTIESPSGQRLGEGGKTFTPLGAPLFDTAGNAVLIATRMDGVRVLAARTTERTFSIMKNVTTFSWSPVAFMIDDSLYLFDGQQLIRSDDLGVTTSVVRTVSDTFRPRQIVAHRSGAVFLQQVAADVFERRFCPNLPGGAPFVTVPAPTTLGGTLVASQLDETETVVRVLGNEFVVLTRVSVLKPAGIEKKLLVERFDLAGTRTSELVLPFSFANLTQQFTFPGGLLLTPTTFATNGFTSSESQVVVFDLTTGATRTTSRSVKRGDTSFEQVSAVGRLLRTRDGKLLWATLDREPIPDTQPPLEWLHPVYRVSADEGVTFGEPIELTPFAAQARLSTWALNPVTGRLLVGLSQTYAHAHFGELPEYFDTPFVASLKSYAVP